ncbi:MAG: hypothetical protein ACXU8U_02865 [Asticcacaulis sp.]
MLIFVLQCLAAVSAFLALAALFIGPASKSPSRRRVMLRTVQFGMAFAGLCLMATCLLGKGWDQAAYGLCLMVFGTGVTAFGRSRKNGADKD